MALKLASLLFFALLITEHLIGGFASSIGWPLSAFRYGEVRLLGYAVLCSLALVGATYIFSLKRMGEFTRIDPRGFFVMLGITAATPSWWTLHEASAIVLLTAVYVYFAVALYRIRPVLMWTHLYVPLLLGIATGFASYGIWQKLFVAYFVVLAAAHEHVLNRGARNSTSNRSVECSTLSA